MIFRANGFVELDGKRRKGFAYISSRWFMAQDKKQHWLRGDWRLGRIVCLLLKLSTYSSCIMFYMGKNCHLFRLFSSFSHSNINYNFNNLNWKKHRLCAWDSNPGLQDGRCRRNSRAMATALPLSFLMSNEQLLKSCSPQLHHFTFHYPTLFLFDVFIFLFVT